MDMPHRRHDGACAAERISISSAGCAPCHRRWCCRTPTAQDRSPARSAACRSTHAGPLMRHAVFGLDRVDLGVDHNLLTVGEAEDELAPCQPSCAALSTPHTITWWPPGSNSTLPRVGHGDRSDRLHHRHAVFFDRLVHFEPQDIGRSDRAQLRICRAATNREIQHRRIVRRPETAGHRLSRPATAQAAGRRTEPKMRDPLRQ